MRDFALLVALTSFVLLGCHKKQPASAPSTQSSEPQVQNSQGAAPAKPLPPPPLSITANADNNVRQGVVGDVDATLTAALRQFVHKAGRPPQSFYEFVRESFDSTPRPPEGKRWVIDSSDMTVKAVAK